MPGKIGLRLQQWNDERTSRLVDAVRASGYMTDQEIDNHLGIPDYHNLVESVGLAIRINERSLQLMLWVAIVLSSVLAMIRRAAWGAWRHGLVHFVTLVLQLVPLVVVLCRFWQTIRCSRRWNIFKNRTARLAGDAISTSCNAAADLILHTATTTACIEIVSQFEWFFGPIIARAVNFTTNTLFLIRQLLSYLFARTTLSMHPIAFINMLRHCRHFSTSRNVQQTLADVLLGRLEPLRRHSTRAEPWIDVSPDGPLYHAVSRTPLMSLWETIDHENRLDEQLFSAVLRSYHVHSRTEIMGAVRQIARPPRPVLSAVIVATGLRTGTAQELARLQIPHLTHERSRWLFFCERKVPPEVSQRFTIIIVTVGQHHAPRIAAGKLSARMLELLLVDQSNLYEFVLSLPVCRQASDLALRRERLVSDIAHSLNQNFFPANATITYLSELSTDIDLPTTKGVSLILGLNQICNDSRRNSGDFVLLSELNDSSSWLNVFHLQDVIRAKKGTCMVSGRRPASGAGKDKAGHVATKLFNVFFRAAVPTVNVRDSSSVLKLATIRSFSTIADKLTCLDYAIDQDILAMMSIEGTNYETPIQWHQALGYRGHERTWNSAGNQLRSVWQLSRKVRLERQLQTLKPHEYLQIDAGFDFTVLLNQKREVFKGHHTGRNRLLLLISSVLSFVRRSDPHAGHHPYAPLVPVATRLIHIVGQGFLKSILRICEGRYRDPLPQIREQLKRDVTIIAHSMLVYDQKAKTLGGSMYFPYGLKQRFASLGTLRVALEWNLSSGFIEGISSTLTRIPRMLCELFRNGSFDPDMKSLYDCGMFLDEGAITVKHLDIGGFICDPRVVERLEPVSLRRIESMKDFRLIARSLRGRAAHRNLVFRLRQELGEFYCGVSQKPNWGQDRRFNSDRHLSEPAPAFSTRTAARNALVYQVMSTARFQQFAPIGELNDQIAIQRLVNYGQGGLLPLRVAPSRVATAPDIAQEMGDVILLVGNPEMSEMVLQGAAKWLPSIHCVASVVNNSKSLPLLSLLRDYSRSGKTTIVMPMMGGSSRMRQLLGGTNCPHKALTPVFGRPLFVHSLTQMLVLAKQHPGMSWVVNPDTVVFWRPDSNKDTARPIVAPLVPAALRIIRAAERRTPSQGNSGRAEVIGKFLARCFLAARTGGYSLPSVLGICPQFLQRLDDRNYGDRAIADFWEYMSSVLGISNRYARGEVSLPSPTAWFDVDTPARLKSLYDYSVATGPCSLMAVAETKPSIETADGARFERSVCANSKVAILRGATRRILFRKCVFDHADVSIDAPPGLSDIVIDGLVVANSCINLRINAPMVRHVLVYNVGVHGRCDAAIDLDCQVIADGPGGNPVIAPLTLLDYAWHGCNEVLRCPVDASGWM